MIQDKKLGNRNTGFIPDARDSYCVHPVIEVRYAKLGDGR